MEKENKKDKKGNLLNGKLFEQGNKAAEKWTEEDALNLGKGLMDWFAASEKNILFNEFFLLEKRMYHTVIYYLRDAYPSFSNLLKEAKKLQEIRLQKGMISSKLNTTGCIFMLKNFHEHKDESSQKIKLNVKNHEVIFKNVKRETDI